MATNAENLATIKTNLITALVTESANPRVSYSIDGQQVLWNEYRASLMKQIADLDVLLAAASGVWEESVIGMP